MLPRRQLKKQYSKFDFSLSCHKDLDLKINNLIIFKKNKNQFAFPFIFLLLPKQITEERFD